MISLDDEEDLVAERPVGSVEPKPRRSFSLRPLLRIIMVLALGGGLGTAVYWLSAMSPRDLIALLDIADQPHLSLPIPGIGPEPAPPPVSASGPGPLLTPPGLPGAVGLTPPAPAGGKALENSPAAPSATSAPKDAEPSAAAPAPAAAPAQPVEATPDQPAPRSPDQAPTYASLPNRLTDPKPLAPAPMEALLRQSAYGPLPVVARDGRQPWNAYARPFAGPAGKARMAVIVTGLGLDKDATDAAIVKLPADVTLAFSPYAGALDRWIKKARDFGHEVMVALPVQPDGFPASDPGPWGLLVNNPPEENIARLEQALARVPGAVGVLATDGPFVRSPKLAPVLIALKDRGLIFVSDGVKSDIDVPQAGVTATIDTDLFRDSIQSRLDGAAAAAKTGGTGSVVLVPRPVAFDRLVGWLDKLGDKGLVLAPATAIVKQSGKS